MPVAELRHLRLNPLGLVPELGLSLLLLGELGGRRSDRVVGLFGFWLCGFLGGRRFRLRLGLRVRGDRIALL